MTDRLRPATEADARARSDLIARSARDLQAAGFTHGEMVATPAGERLYARHGWVAEARYTETLPGGIALPVIRMTKWLQAGQGDK
ncbi:MAG: hypothetical protein ACK5SX_08085 [Sandaracinobacter sp.]